MPDAPIEPADAPADARRSDRRLRLDASRTMAARSMAGRARPTATRSRTSSKLPSPRFAAVQRDRRPRVRAHGRRGPCASVRSPTPTCPTATRHTPERWRGALNAHLPAEIRVSEVRLSPTGFPRAFRGQGQNLPLPHLERPGARSRWKSAARGIFPAPLDLDVLRQAGAIARRAARFRRFRRQPGHSRTKTPCARSGASPCGGGPRSSPSNSRATVFFTRWCVC